MPRIRNEDEASSVEDDLDALQNLFATLLNIHEDPNYPQPLAIWERGSGFPTVGESDPYLTNLGNSWNIRYKSVRSLVPADGAASRLSVFYQRIVDLAAERIGSSMALRKSLVFGLKDLSLRLDSPAPIPWEWVIRFSRGMWDLAIINIALNIG